MSSPTIHTITTEMKGYPLPKEGFMAVISPPTPWTPSNKQDTTTIYYLKESATVLIWVTRQGRKVTTWARDVLNNVWIVLDEENKKSSDNPG